MRILTIHSTFSPVVLCYTSYYIHTSHLISSPSLILISALKHRNRLRAPYSISPAEQAHLNQPVEHPHLNITRAQINPIQHEANQPPTSFHRRPSRYLRSTSIESTQSSQEAVTWKHRRASLSTHQLREQACSCPFPNSTQVQSLHPIDRSEASRASNDSPEQPPNPSSHSEGTPSSSPSHHLLASLRADVSHSSERECRSVFSKEGLTT